MTPIGLFSTSSVFSSGAGVAGIILVATVNSIGAIFQLVHITIFISCADKPKKVKMLGLLLAVFTVFAVIVFASIRPRPQIFDGYLLVASPISMFVSPLFIINLVIKTKSVKYMLYYLSLSTFLTSLSFFAYGMFKDDQFISVPNGVGSVLGILYNWHCTPITADYLVKFQENPLNSLL